ncbi:MAG TPA: hypothetical protein VF002_10250 [Gaiellaceae bacterium]
MILAVIAVGALALAALGFAKPGPGHGSGRATANGGTLTFDVVTTDHGCDYRAWATDTITRTYKVKKREDGSYTLRQENKGRFVTLQGQSPSADPCPGVLRRRRHGQTLKAGITGKLHGYLQGTVTGGSFNPGGTCTAACSSSEFVAGFFTSGATFTCSQGYAGCRFSFEYTAQRQRRQRLRYHHWVDRGTDGVHEIFGGDIATG